MKEIVGILGLMMGMAGCTGAHMQNGGPVEREYEPAETRWVMVKQEVREAGDAVVGEKLLVFERVGHQDRGHERGINVEVRGASPVGEPVEAWVSMNDACSMEVFEVRLEARDVTILGASRFELRGGERASVRFLSEVPGERSIRITTRRIKTCNGVRD